MAEAGKLDDALAWLWHDVGSRLPDEERLTDVLFTAARYQDGARSIVVVALPRPEHINEAHFIAVVVCEKVMERYFVLEHSWNLDDSPSTWLGEWTAESHLSLGSGTPAGDEFGFLDLV